MKYAAFAALLFLTFAASADFNRTTSLIDIPKAEVLPHGVVKGGVSVSLSEDGPSREENFNLSLGLFDRVEVSLGVLSREAVEVNLVWKVLEEGRGPALAIGVWDITTEEYVSDPGFGSNAYSDELAYGTNRAREQFSGFCVLSKKIVPFASLHAGLGRGRFVVWGPRSKHFKVGDEPNSAVALFFGVDAELWPGFRLMGELDGRDVNVGMKYSMQWFEMGFAVTKLEHFMFDSPDYFTRFVVGGSVNLQAFKRVPAKPPVVEAPLAGSISGMVMDGESWEPIEASVNVLGTDMIAYSDVYDGSFSIEDLSPGLYVVEVAAIGYKVKTFSITVEPGKATVEDFFLSPVEPAKEEPKEKLVIDVRVYFETNRAEFTRESLQALELVARLLEQNPKARVEIRGYTDSVGSSEYNVILSRERAGAVKTYLVDVHGIDPGRLKAEGCGEANPIGDNGTREGRTRNRRVEFEVIE